MRPEVIKWDGGEHQFALDIGGLRAVQDRCDAGPLAVLCRLLDGSWKVEDVLTPLRHGLTGGGMSATEAEKLVRDMAAETPLVRLVRPAAAVLSIALHGPEDDPLEDGDAAGKPDAPQTSESGASPKSTAQA